MIKEAFLTCALSFQPNFFTDSYSPKAHVDAIRLIVRSYPTILILSEQPNIDMWWHFKTAGFWRVVGSTSLETRSPAYVQALFDEQPFRDSTFGLIYDVGLQGEYPGESKDEWFYKYWVKEMHRISISSGYYIGFVEKDSLLHHMLEKFNFRRLSFALQGMSIYQKHHKWWEQGDFSRQAPFKKFLPTSSSKRFITLVEFIESVAPGYAVVYINDREKLLNHGASMMPFTESGLRIWIIRKAKLRLVEKSA